MSIATPTHRHPHPRTARTLERKMVLILLEMRKAARSLSRSFSLVSPQMASRPRNLAYLVSAYTESEKTITWVEGGGGGEVDDIRGQQRT
jgi:hypothetical protein